MSRVLTRREVVLALGAAAILVACGERPIEPVALALGREECAWCRMRIDDARFPAQLVTAPGRARFFDEPGCLLSWMADHPEATGTAFVTAVETTEWLPAERAHFAMGRMRTPMRFDITAHASTPAANGAGDGTPLTWRTLLAKGAPDARHD
jgi:copper chaperone NosL